MKNKDDFLEEENFFLDKVETEKKKLSFLGLEYESVFRFLSTDVVRDISDTIKESGYTGKQDDEFVSQNELSAVSITSEGIVHENWVSTKNISSKIIEVLDNSVKLECLIDKEIKLFQEREFKKSLFDGMEPIAVGQLILLQIKERPKEIKISIIRGDGIVPKEDFEQRDLSKKFENSPIFKLAD